MRVEEELEANRRLIQALEEKLAERDRALAVLAEDRAFREAVIEHAAEGVCVCNNIPIYPYIAFSVWNRRMIEITGYTMEEINKRGWYQTLYPDPERQQRARARMERMRVGDNLMFERWQITRSDGEQRWIAISTSVLTARDGSAHVLGLMHDISEPVRLAQAEETIRQRDEFLAILSHELRNLLAPVSNGLYMLDRVAPGSEQAQRALRVIARQAAHITRLVGDLLDVTRASRGMITLQRERLELGELVRRAVEDHRPLFVQRGVALDVHVTDERLWVDGDETRLTQVIGNLLQNAAKFTGRGGTTAMLLETDAARRLAIVRVRDTGIGLSAEMLPRIFEPFMQADSTRDRSRGGLGLGLALAKSLVELHGGTVEARSEGLGTGAEFAVRLPLAEGAEAPLVAAAPPAAPAHARRRVLVIEDNIDAAELLAAALRRRNHEVAVAHHSREGIKKAREFQPDVVLCDIGLPEMNGYEVARAFRADAALEGTVLVALTGYAGSEDEQRAAEAGFDFHLAKPTPLHELETLIAQVPERSSSTAAAGSPPPAEPVHRLDPAKLLESIGRCLMLYIDTRDTARVFDTMLTILLELTQSEYGFIGEVLQLQDGQRYLKTHAISNVAWDVVTKDLFQRAAPNLEFFNLKTLFGAVITTSKVVIANDPAHDPRSTGTPPGHPPLTHFLGIPYFYGTELVGMVGIANRPGGYAESLVEQLQPFLAACAQIVAGYRGRAAEERLESERDRLIASLRETDRRKTEFLAMLSHELRNPITPIRNSLHVLDRTAPGSEQAQRAHRIIARQTAHITRLIDDLLDASRMSLGTPILLRRRLDLRDVVRHAIEDHGPVFEQRGVVLDARITHEPIWVNGDGTRLEQALGNLLQNAACFTDRGGTATVLLEKDPAGDLALIRVRDTGVGVSPQMLPRLFEPFTQADGTLDRSRGGLGLGLALVKWIVELHDGTVEASSQGLGAGAEFTVRLPLERAKAEARPVAAAPPAVPIRARRVLIIEDNIDAAESLKEALQLDGHEVAVAYDGPEGIEKAHEWRPDVVLCDIGLPEMDGYGVARALRADAALEGVLLVALTGYARTDDQRLAAEAGFARHLAKPPNIEQLKEVIAAAPRRPPDVSPGAPTLPPGPMC